jgi:hypothetical protein
MEDKNVENCVKFVENYLGWKLFPFQEEILHAWENGLEVRTARCLGRSKLAEAYGKYITYKLEKNNYEKMADVMFSYTCALSSKLLTDKSIKLAKELLTEKEFNREYLCE